MRKILMLVLLCISLGSTQVFAQMKTVTGKVTDESGNPVTGATVQARGSKGGTTTDFGGSFTIRVPQSVGNLTITSVNFTEQEVGIGSGNVLVQLKASASNLSEVVVVGYGTQKRSVVTGSVTTVGGKELENKPFTSVDKALQGEVAGLQSVAGSGAPGSTQDIRIRGISSINASNAPLWVIDGAIVNTGDASRLTTSANLLSTLNSNDIESVTVLKDAASTSIYGSRGANGVILITTKKGRPGKTKFRFDTEVGQTGTAYKNSKYQPLNAGDYLAITREGLVNGGYNQATIDAQLTSLGNGNGTDYDWLGAVTRNGSQQQYNLSASGGNEKTTFYLSGGYFRQDGTTIATDLKRYNGAARITNQATDKLSFSLNLDGGVTQQNTPLNGGSFGSPVLTAYFQLPTKNAYKPDGTFNILTPEFQTSGVFNPIALATMDKRFLKEFSLRGNFTAEYKILNSLVFKSSYGGDFNTLEEDQYNNPFYGDGAVLNAGSPTYGPNISYNSSSTGRAYDYYTRYYNYTWTNTLDYRYNFNRASDIYATLKVGYENQLSKAFFISSQGTGFPLTLALPYAASTATPKTASSTISNYSFVSEFANGNFSYKDKYVVSGSIRRDGSSRFSPNNKYGTFWSVGGTWNMNKEEFMNNVTFINQLKLRGSYGKTGNAGIGNYDYFPGYGFGANYNSTPGSYPNNVGNLDLTWENNRQLDLGADISILKNRLNVTADYYNRKSTDLLLDVQLSRTSGFTSVRKNIGALSNKGVELTINAIPVQTKDFSWTIDFNYSHNKNMITSLPDGKDIANGAFLFRQGYDVQSYFTRVYAGVDPANGDPLWYTDSSQKTTTNVYPGTQSRVIYGSASPKYFGSFTNTFNYKGFSLQAQFYYSAGNYVYDSWGSYYVGAGFGATYNKVERVLDRWQKPGDVTDIPKYVYGGNKSFNSFSTFYLAKGDYIRLRNLQVGYTIPKTILSKAGISSAFFYVRGTNLWTWVKDKNLSFDPEQGVTSTTNLNVFVPKTMSVGLNIGF